MNHRVYAVQDENCLDHVKFRVKLGAPLVPAFAMSYPQSEVLFRHFSNIIPNALDLMIVERKGVLKLEGAVGSDELIASFHGDPALWPWEPMRELSEALKACGYGTVHYVEGDKPNCAGCQMGRLKQCRPWQLQQNMPTDSVIVKMPPYDN